MKTEIKNDTIFIKFNYDASLIQKVKTLNGRKYDSGTKTWNCPDNDFNRKKLKELGFDINIDHIEVIEKKVIIL